MRAGIVKLGASYQHLQPAERRRFRVGAEAALRCAVPLAVHTEIGTAVHDILEELEPYGVSPSSVMLAHLDRNPDLSLHAELASRGAFLGADVGARGTVRALGGGPDMAVLGRSFIPRLRDHCGDELVATLLERSPRRLFVNAHRQARPQSWSAAGCVLCR